MRRSCLCFLLLLLFFACAASQAIEASREPLVDPCDIARATSLELEGVGVASFGDLQYSSREDQARLLGGVCIKAQDTSAGAPAWTLSAPLLEVTALSTEPRLSAEQVVLTLQDWRISAMTFSSDVRRLELTDLVFSRQQLTGRAQEGHYDLLTGSVTFEGIAAREGRYLIQSERAVYQHSSLQFENAVATTCLCEGDAPYTLRAPNATLDLQRGTMMLHDGILQLGALEIALAPAFEVSEAFLTQIAFPLQFKFSPTTSGQPGTGFGVVLPALPLDDGFSVELGLLGLDADHPLTAVALLHVLRPGIRATVGQARFGVQADVLLEQTLAPGIVFEFGINNRHWRREQDFLHEGFLAVRAVTELRDLIGGDALDLSARTFAAFSSQIVGTTTVMSPRLGASFGASYTLPPTALGTFSIANVTNVTYYPGTQAVQYGVRLTPTWRGAFGPVRTEVIYDRRWTNSTSPFAGTLDRLSPIQTLRTSVLIGGPLIPGLEGSITAASRHNFRRDTPVEAFAFGASLRYTVDDLLITPLFELELAALLNPLTPTDANIRAFVGGGINLRSPVWEAGAGTRYNLKPGQEGLQWLELYGAYPITLGDITLKPFLALDFAVTLQHGEPPAVSGHGLDLSWHHCCGTLALGYRSHRDRFTTTFSLELPH